MCKKIAVLVLVFMAIFCFWGPIKGGQADEVILPKYNKVTKVKHFTTKKQDVNISETKVCKASWYGPGFHGRPTASGEIFDENTLTAAHKELPFGTKIKVTNLNNDKSIVVTINDRGPYIAGRELDLSKAAAQRVEMIEAGVVNVKMEILK